MFRISSSIAGVSALCLVTVWVALAPLAVSAAEQASTTASSGETEAAPPNIHELLTLLADPKIQEWLKKQADAKAAVAARKPDKSVDLYLSSRADAIHDQIVALASAIPDLPNQFRRAGARDIEIHGGYRRAVALLNLIVFVALGFGAQWVFRKATGRVRRRLDALSLDATHHRLQLVAVRIALATGVIVAFALGSAGLFLTFDRDPTLRGTVLDYLLAGVAIRIAVAVGDLLFAPGDERFRVIPTDVVAARFWCRRITVFVVWSVLGWLIVRECSALGFSFQGLELVAYTLGLGLVGIALEAVWRGHTAPKETAEPLPERHHFGRGARNTALSIGIVLLWALWVTQPGIDKVGSGFWLILVAIILPFSIYVSRNAIEHLLRPPGANDTTASNQHGILTVCLERGVRALLIIGAAALLAWAWGVDLVSLAGQDTFFARAVHGVLSAIIILLVADVLWHAVKAAIDGKLSAVTEMGPPNTEEARRRARLRTLLPIFRNILFVLVLVIAALMALTAMGVEIGPLIAGLGVFGVAVGFGAQTFVRDVIAGMFYLMDDAFRVGEYIQAGNYKGTVEGFSIRSVKLRHHRGPVYTVPFSLLGAVQNQSRDWVIDKMMIGITYDSDLEKARKLIKGIGQELAQDPEFAPLIIEPLKMQGVEHFGEFAVQIRMKMMTVPGEQFVIRRKALAMIKKAFDENGIKFAFPTVQVAGEVATPPTAAAAQRALELVPGGLTEGGR